MMAWVLYIVVVTSGSANAGISLHTQQFYSKEECLRVGNLLTNKLLGGYSINNIKTLCVEQMSPTK